MANTLYNFIASTNSMKINLSQAEIPLCINVVLNLEKHFQLALNILLKKLFLQFLKNWGRDLNMILIDVSITTNMLLSHILTINQLIWKTKGGRKLLCIIAKKEMNSNGFSFYNRYRSICYFDVEKQR